MNLINKNQTVPMYVIYKGGRNYLTCVYAGTLNSLLRWSQADDALSFGNEIIFQIFCSFGPPEVAEGICWVRRWRSGKR